MVLEPGTDCISCVSWRAPLHEGIWGLAPAAEKPTLYPSGSRQASPSLTLSLPSAPHARASLCVLIYSDNRHDLKIKSRKGSTFKALPTDSFPFGQVLPSEAKRSENSVKWSRLSRVLDTLPSGGLSRSRRRSRPHGTVRSEGPAVSRDGFKYHLFHPPASDQPLKNPEIIRINSPEAFCGGLNEVIHVKMLGGILVTWYSIKVIDYFNYFIIIIIALRRGGFSGYLNDLTSGSSYC